MVGLPRSGFRFLYGCIYGGLALCAVPSIIFLLIFQRDYRSHLWERWGFYPDSLVSRPGGRQKRRLWVHAVSVGEVDVALFVIRLLSVELPGWDFVLTTVTPEGRHLAERRRPPHVHLCYAPFDFAGAVRRGFQAIHAEALVLIELEMWPGLLWEADRLDLPIMVVNGRLPESDLTGYRRVRWFMKHLFKLPCLICVQTPLDARAFQELGSSGEALHVTGNLKFDLAMEAVGEVLPDAPRKVLVAGSTHPGEEDLLLEMLPRLRAEFPDLLLVLAPRDISRVPQIDRRAVAEGFRTTRRSSLDPDLQACGATGPVLLVDTIGDLKSIYREASVVFIGKSLLARGGQNPMEPAAAGRAVIFGPYMENFSWSAERLLEKGGGVQVQDAHELEAEILRLLRHPEESRKIGWAAREVVEANSGAGESTVRRLLGTLRSKGLF